jgi:hypothetical protein
MKTCKFYFGSFSLEQGVRTYPNFFSFQRTVPYRLSTVLKNSAKLAKKAKFYKKICAFLSLIHPIAKSVPYHKI